LQQHDKSKAVYAQSDIAIFGGLSLTAGGRYTWDTRASTFGQMNAVAGPPAVAFTCASATGLPPTTPQSNCLRTISADFEGYGYTFALNWQVNDNLLLYATTRRNYKAGGQNFINTLVTGLLTYEPETATDVEIGLKSEWQLGGLSGRFNVAAYDAKYDDMQRQVLANTGGAVATVIYNAAGASIKGIELESTLLLTDDLAFDLFYNYTDAGYDNFTDPATGADLSANRLIGTPENSGGATLRYKHQLGGLGEFVGSVSVYARSEMALVANQIQNPFNDSEGYETYSARLGLNNIAGYPVDVAIWGDNLSDEEYQVAALGLYGTTLGYNSAVYGEPRMYGIELKYRFGQ